MSPLAVRRTEVQFTHRISQMPRLTPQVAAGVNLIDGEFQMNAPLDQVRSNSTLHAR